jgi:hypothetical protein
MSESALLKGWDIRSLRRSNYEVRRVLAHEYKNAFPRLSNNLPSKIVIVHGSGEDEGLEHRRKHMDRISARRANESAMGML